MQSHSHSGGHTNAPPPPSTTSSRPDTTTEQHPSLLHLLASFPIDLQLNITSRLYPLDLQDLTLSCRAARDMVYSAHVTKLTFTEHNMQELPTCATMSERYPAVSYIAMKYGEVVTKRIGDSSTEEVQHVVECLQSLVHQNSEETMRGITQLDLTLTDSAACRTSIMAVADLLKACTSLRRLVCVYDEGSPSVVLVLDEQAPGQGLQHHGDLLDHGADLGQVLGSAACRAELRHLMVAESRTDITAVDVACSSALPHLSALHVLQVLTFPSDHHVQSPATQSQMATWTNLEFTPKDGGSSGLVDMNRLPALRQLTCLGRGGFNEVVVVPLGISSLMQSLTQLTLSHMTLKPAIIRGLSRLQDLDLFLCSIEGPISSLTSDIQALSGLTRLEVKHVRGLVGNRKRDVTYSLHLETVTQLLQLSIGDAGDSSIPSFPTSLTSLDAKVHRLLAGGLPTTWLSLTHLVRLNLSLHFAVARGCEGVLPVVAQLVTLEHLHVGMERALTGYTRPHKPEDDIRPVVDATCLDNLTRLTHLEFYTDANLATPEWPQLAQAARLQHLGIRGLYSDCSTLSLPHSLVELHITTNSDTQLPRALSSCSALRSLRVCSNPINAADVGISRLSPLTSLQRLELLVGRCPVSEADLATIASLSNLQYLSLRVIIAGSLCCLSALKQLIGLKLCERQCQRSNKELALLRVKGLFPRLRGGTLLQ